MRSVITILLIGAVVSVGLFFLLTNQKGAVLPARIQDNFVGERGEEVQAQGSRVLINEDKVGDGNLHPFHYYSEAANKNIYFFVVKARDNTYRVAANACEICFNSKKGFTQVSDQIRCENCRTVYTKDQIALEKGGCNPRPIDPAAQVIDGQLTINVVAIESAADLF